MLGWALFALGAVLLAATLFDFLKTTIGMTGVDRRRAARRAGNRRLGHPVGGRDGERHGDADAFGQLHHERLADDPARPLAGAADRCLGRLGAVLVGREGRGRARIRSARSSPGWTSRSARRPSSASSPPSARRWACRWPFCRSARCSGACPMPADRRSSPCCRCRRCAGDVRRRAGREGRERDRRRAALGREPTAGRVSRFPAGGGSSRVGAARAAEPPCP